MRDRDNIIEGDPEEKEWWIIVKKSVN